ncbi:MAG TPA: hypothetical protein PK299_10440 [Anaerolineales bacterium]|nr:hypothetical protein [Anaerolineales bacterium]
MSKPINENNCKKLSQAIQENPGKPRGFFARLFGWKFEKVERTLADMESKRLYVSEDKGKLWPFK